MTRPLERGLHGALTKRIAYDTATSQPSVSGTLGAGMSMWAADTGPQSRVSIRKELEANVPLAHVSGCNSQTLCYGIIAVGHAQVDSIVSATGRRLEDD